MKFLFSITLVFFAITAHSQGNVSQQAQTIASKAEQGDLASINMMGNLYKNGAMGLEKNLIEAKKWFEKGAQLNYAPSHFNLGLIYESGGNGVQQDVGLAKKYYESASKLGFAKADEKLAALKNSQQPIASKPVDDSTPYTLVFLCTDPASNGLDVDTSKILLQEFVRLTGEIDIGKSSSIINLTGFNGRNGNRSTCNASSGKTSPADYARLNKSDEVFVIGGADKNFYGVRSSRTMTYVYYRMK